MAQTPSGPSQDYPAWQPQPQQSQPQQSQPQQPQSQQPPHWPYPYGYLPRPQPQPEPPHRRRWPAVAALGVVAAGLAIGLGVNAATDGGGVVVSGQGSAPSNANPVNPALPANTAATTATAAQSVGVVDIDTVLQYQGAQAAGTGMILTSSGEVLTNNHVVQGATSIKVTVVSSGATYTAQVVGTDPTDDVAVIQLQGASGLQTAKTGDSSGVSAGDSVTAVGNAGGTGGTPSAAEGSVVATDQSLTASDESGANPETLTGMIEINAGVVAGDSGGPLYDSHGKVIGMDTAASSSGFGAGAQTASTAYAIPIDKALNIAGQIESGHETGTIHIGYPGFLGVGLSDSFNGAVVTNVADGTPAAQAGLQAGDVITAVGGTTIQSADDVSSAIAGHDPGDHLSISWTDTLGQSHTATVTLATGPAD